VQAVQLEFQVLLLVQELRDVPPSALLIPSSATSSATFSAPAGIVPALHAGAHLGRRKFDISFYSLQLFELVALILREDFEQFIIALL
jgi:hypothetical protein